MPIELKTIETRFFDALQPHPAFAGWKKKARTLVGPKGDIQFGIELMRTKASFANAQRVAVAAFASISCEIGPDADYLIRDDGWAKGRLIRRNYLVPGKGMVGDRTLGGGTLTCLREDSDAVAWAASLVPDIEAFIMPWLRSCDSVATVCKAYRREHPFLPNVHITLSHSGVAPARAELLDYLETWRHQPNHPHLFEWSAEHGLLSADEANKFKWALIPQLPALVQAARAVVAQTLER